METDEPKDYQTCLHCGARLRLNANSTVCRKCRFEGHKEYGDCDKCPPPIAAFQPAHLTAGKFTVKN